MPDSSSWYVRHFFFLNMSVVWDGLYTEMFLLVCTNKASSCRNKIMILHDELMY